jgi:hypothetical protein
MAIPAGLMLGLQVGTIQRKYENSKEIFKEDVKKTIQKANYIYASWNSHTSNEYDKKTFDTLYNNKDSSFVFMIAQSIQKYPSLKFQGDSNLPALRKSQFLKFKDELEKTRKKENKHLKEFYIFRSIQYCLNCKEDKMSVAEIFPLDSLVKAQLKLKKINTDVKIAFYSQKTKFKTELFFKIT